MKKTFLLLVACFLSLGIYAQDSNEQLLKKLVEKQVLTQEEANQIKEESAKTSLTETATKIREAFNTPYMRFGGYGMLTYKYNEYSRNHHDFRARVVFISVNGKITNTISYGILAEFVDPTLHEYFGEWTPSKYFNVKAGQFKIPFSIENSIALFNLETIYNTRSISSLVGMADDVLKYQNSKNSGGRDIGIQASGSLLKRGDRDLLQYSVGIFQGAGINITADNNDKAFSGMLYLLPVKGFRLGGGAYFGEATYSVDKATIPVGDHVRNRWVLSSDYSSDRFYARAEWLHGNDGGIKKQGLYGLGAYYLIPKKLNVLAKVDYYNNNTNINSEVLDYTCAVNYYFFPQCRFQLNYTYSDYNKKWDARNTNMVAAQMQIVF